jgi:hypothetical protein
MPLVALTTFARSQYALSLTIDTTLSREQLENLTLNFTADYAAIHTGGWPPGVSQIVGNLTPYVSAFSFTDGSGFSITQANATKYGFDVTTDGNGNIQSWVIFAEILPPAGPALSISPKRKLDSIWVQQPRRIRYPSTSLWWARRQMAILLPQSGLERLIPLHLPTKSTPPDSGR